jgi:predicted ester cyclase
MNPEEMQSRMRRVIAEAYDNGNTAALDELYAPTVAKHQPPLVEIQGLPALKQFVGDVHSAYAGLRIIVDEIIVAGDTSCMRGYLQGTQTGRSPSLGAAPAGKYVNIPMSAVHHWVEGKIVEEWTYFDYLGLLRQLGLYPPAGQAKAK